jgi:predicted kinase
MFKLNGEQYSLEDLQKAAEKYNMEFDAYMEVMKTKGLEEIASIDSVDTSKKEDLQTAGATVGEMQVPDMDLTSEAGSLEFPGTEVEPEPLPSFESFIPESEYITTTRSGRRPTTLGIDEASKKYDEYYTNISPIALDLKNVSLDSAVEAYKEEYSDLGFEFHKKSRGIAITAPNGSEQTFVTSLGGGRQGYQGQNWSKAQEFIERNKGDQKAWESKKAAIRGIESIMSDIIEKEDYYDLDYGTLNLKQGKDVAILDSKDLFYNHPDLVQGIKNEAVKRYNRYNVEDREKTLFGDTAFQVADISDYRLDEITENVFAKAMAQDAAYKAEQTKEIILKEAKEKFEGDLNALADWATNAGAAEVQDPIEKRIANSWRNVYKLQNALDSENLTPEQQVGYNENLSKAAKEAAELTKKHLNPNNVILFNPSEGFTKTLKPGSSEEGGINIAPQVQEETTRLVALKNGSFKALQNRYVAHRIDLTDMRKNLSKELEVTRGDGSKYKATLSNLVNQHIMGTGKFIPGLSEDIEARGPKGDDLGTGAIQEVFGKREIEGIAKEYMRLKARDVAFKNMYLLNINPKSVERSGFWASAGEGFLESLSSGEVVDFYSGPNASDVLSEVKEVGDEAGIEWDTDQLNNFKETGKEFLGTTVGGLPVLASEFALANVVAGATLAVAGGDVFIAGLKAGKYYKAGRKAAMSTDEILSGAAADGYKGSILSKPVQKWVSMQPGIIKVGGGVVDRLTALTLEATIEGFKMQGVVGDSGFGMGAAFTPAAALVNTLAGRLGVRFKAKGAFHKLNDIVLKPLKGGIVMVPSAEGGAIIEAAIDDYIGGKDFNTYLDENFRDIEWLGEGGIYRRYLGHAVTGAALSYSHLPVKKILTKTLNGQMDLSAKAFEEINLINAQIEQELKLEGGKTRISRVLKPKLEKALEIYVAADNYISEAYALNEATDPQANARQASRDIEKTVKDFKKRTGKDLNLSLSIEMKGENLNGKAAEVTKREDGGWNITVDARKYHKGIFGHELGHVYGEIFGLNSPESLGKIVDFINKTVKKNTGEDLKALVEKSYEGKQAKELNSEEYLMAVIEILGKGGSGLVRNNVYGEIVQNLKGFYERRMKKGFDGKAPQLKIESPQELLNLLQRLSKGVGKDGSVKQFQQLSNLYLNNTKIFDGTTKEIKGTYGSENISEQIANIMLEQRRIASIPASERSAAQIQKLKDNVIKIKELKAEETEIIDVKKPAVKALNKKVIFLAGAAGSGKTTLIKNLGLPSKGFEIINQDPLLEKFSKEAGLPADMNKLTSEQKEDWRAAQEKAGKETRERLNKLREAGTGLVFDSTGAGKATMERDIREFKQAGYDVKLIFVDSPLEKSLERNRQRERVLTDTAVRNSYEAVLANKKRFKEVLGTDLIEINTSDAEAARKATSDISSKINEFIGEKKTIIDADTKFEKLAQLKKENIELAEKFGKEPIPGPAEKRLEKEIIEDLKDPINKLITNRTKALFDPIPEEARAGVTREKFQDSMRSDLVAMVLNEYKPGKQSIEKFLINRGYVRAFNLAERLGIKAAEKGIDKGIEAAEKVAAEPTSVEPTKGVKLIEPVERLIKDPELKNKFKKQVEEATKDFDPGEVNYKTLVDAAPELTRKVFGEVLKENGKVDKAKTKKLQQQFIRNNAEVIYALLPEGARKFATGLKTATGIQASLLKNFYETGERTKMQTGTEAGLKTQTKKPFNKEAFLEVFGANKNQPQNRNQQTAIDALIKEVGKAMTNRAYRQALEAQEVSMNTIQKIADGKSINMASHGVAEKFGKVLLENPSEKNQAIAAQAISMISRNLPKFYPEVAFVMRNSAKKRNVTLESIVQENIMEAALWKNNYEKDGLNYVPASEIASNEVIIDKGKKTTRKQRYADSVVTLLEYFGDPEAASPSVRNAFYSAVGYNKMIKLGGPDGLRISQKNFNANNRTELLENAFNKGQKINFNKEKGFFEKNLSSRFFHSLWKRGGYKKIPFWKRL